MTDVQNWNILTKSEWTDTHSTVAGCVLRACDILY